MSRKWVWFGVLAFAVALFPRARADQTLAPVTGWLPDDVLAVVEVTQPGAVLDALFAPQATEAITSSPPYKNLAASSQFRPLLAVTTYLETSLGMGWRDLVRRLAGDGATFVLLRQGGPLLVLDTADADVSLRLNNALLGLIRADAKNKGNADPVTSKTHRGVTMYTIGSKISYALAGRQLLVAPRDAALAAALDARASGPRRSLGQSAAYRAARDAAGSQAAARAYVNFRVLKQTPKMQAALHRDLNVAAALLISGFVGPLQASDWVAAGLDLHGGVLTLRATCDGKVGESKAAAFTWPAADAGARPPLIVPRMIASGSLYRDLKTFYSAKDALFPERSSGLVFFENMLEIAFSGRETPENILGETMPDIRFVVARQEYQSGLAPPATQAPAFAVVFRLRHPQEFSENLEEGWQKMIGLANITRGQKALPGFIFDRRRHNDVEFALARFGKPSAEERKELPVRFNFSPALAIVGQYAVLSSTEGLTRELIDVLKRSPADEKPLTATNAVIEVDGGQLTAVLGANRQSIAAANMIKNGESLEEALGKFDALLTALSHAERAALRMTARDDRPLVTLELKLK